MFEFDINTVPLVIPVSILLIFILVIVWVFRLTSNDHTVAPKINSMNTKTRDDIMASQQLDTSQISHQDTDEEKHEFKIPEQKNHDIREVNVPAHVDPSDSI
jgi:hypothetical protein